MNQHATTRRQFLETTGAGLSVAALAPWAARAVASEDKDALPRGKAKHCVMIWLAGGPAQIDTWDPKERGNPEAGKPGSYYDRIETAIPGVQVCEHLGRCAKILDRFNLLRTVHHGVINEHAAATNRMHTGRPTRGTTVYPSIGSIVAHQLGPVGDSVPAYVLIGYPSPSRGSGFLGPDANYVYLTDTKSGPKGFTPPAHVSKKRLDRRYELLAKQRAACRERIGGGERISGYDGLISEALRLSGPEFMNVFQLDEEPAKLRESYGGEFGQRCLLTRRLFQAGVRFIEVSHNLTFTNGTGWDVHNDGILKQHLLIEELDQGLAALVRDLEDHKMLDETLVVVAGEFGRPGRFDSGGGRGHWGDAFSVALAGGGLQNGKVIGQTNEVAEQIVERPVSVPDLHATIHATLGIDPHADLYNGSRPVPITDKGQPVGELFG